MSDAKIFYDKRIKYLEEVVDGERMRCAGFVKAEVRGEICKFTIQVKGLHTTDHFDKPILLLHEGGESNLCNLSIREGRGATGEICCNRQVLGSEKIPYEAIQEIQIPLAAGRKLCCSWQELKKEREVITKPEEEVELEVITKPKEEVELEVATKPDRRISFPLEDKWKQLWEIYPHVNPFEDEREYLSIGPSDFVILPAHYYRLVNNSFLLHGYHNYGHLILWRTEVKGELRYYIGVPGNYYEKEKQVAIMFGFESFECKMEPADWGAYGYYMMRVEV